MFYLNNNKKVWDCEDTELDSKGITSFPAEDTQSWHYFQVQPCDGAIHHQGWKKQKGLKEKPLWNPSVKLWNSPSGNGNEQTSCRMHYTKQTSASPWPDTRNNSIKNTLVLLASRSTFFLHWLLCINEKLVALMVKVRLGPVCGLGHTVESQETLWDESSKLYSKVNGQENHSRLERQDGWMADCRKSGVKWLQGLSSAAREMH